MALTLQVFLISAIWGIGGAVVTWIWLPDTTGLELEEYDRMQRCVLEGRFQDYHGEAVNPKHLSPWEVYVLGWHKVGARARVGTRGQLAGRTSVPPVAARPPRAPAVC